jgi:hypothetical protein
VCSSVRCATLSPTSDAPQSHTHSHHHKSQEPRRIVHISFCFHRTPWPWGDPSSSSATSRLFKLEIEPVNASSIRYNIHDKISELQILASLEEFFYESQRKIRWQSELFGPLHYFWARSQNSEEATVSFAISVSVHPSLRVGQISSHWTDFHEICYSSIFRIFMEFVIRTFSKFLWNLLFEYFPNFHEICYSNIFWIFIKFVIRAFSE